MAIGFHHFTDAHEELLAESLEGIPPRLPTKRSTVGVEWVWVDELLTLEDEEGSEVSELIGDVDDEEIEFASLAGALHAARPRWF